VQKLLIATRNPGKVKELSYFLRGLPLELVSLKDIGVDEDVEETGKTYTENSQKKALFYAKLSGLPAISDDGGLEIEALGGAPGVKSRRWIGEDKTEKDLIEHMKQIAKELPDKNRTAYFRTVVSLALPDGRIWSKSGQVRGIIAKKPFLKLSKGYPYRSFFYLPKIKKYYHEKDLSESETKLYNHRWKAVQKLISIIKEELGFKQ
jgi:XTP/dITP diphosphohydrolase